MQALSIAWSVVTSPFRKSKQMLNSRRVSADRCAQSQHTSNRSQPSDGDSSSSLSFNTSAFVKQVADAAEAIFTKYVSGDNLVDYAALMASSELQAWRDMSPCLAHIEFALLTNEEKVSLFVNTYNLATVDAICRRGGPSISSVLTIFKFWKTYGYTIGGHSFTLDDMEHGILRGNRPHPSSRSSSYFAVRDARGRVSVNELDKRIHFALVCGAKGCPLLRVVRPDSVDADLQLLAESFVRERVVVAKSSDSKRFKVELSMILKWYMVDFGVNEFETLIALKPFMSKEQLALVQELEALDDQTMSKAAKISFTKYNWSLNNNAAQS